MTLDASGRAHEPAADRHGEQQQQQRPVRDRRQHGLPAHDGAGQRRRRMAPAPQQATDRQHQHGEADPFVPVVGVELGEAERQAGHPQPNAQHADHRRWR